MNLEELKNVDFSGSELSFVASPISKKNIELKVETVANSGDRHYGYGIATYHDRKRIEYKSNFVVIFEGESKEIYFDKFTFSNRRGRLNILTQSYDLRYGEALTDMSQAISPPDTSELSSSVVRSVEDEAPIEANSFVSIEPETYNPTDLFIPESTLRESTMFEVNGSIFDDQSGDYIRVVKVNDNFASWSNSFLLKNSNTKFIINFLSNTKKDKQYIYSGQLSEDGTHIDTSNTLYISEDFLELQRERGAFLDIDLTALEVKRDSCDNGKDAYSILGGYNLKVAASTDPKPTAIEMSGICIFTFAIDKKCMSEEEISNMRAAFPILTRTLYSQ